MDLNQDGISSNLSLNFFVGVRCATRTFPEYLIFCEIIVKEEGWLPLFIPGMTSRCRLLVVYI